MPSTAVISGLEDAVDESLVALSSGLDDFRTPSFKLGLVDFLNKSGADEKVLCRLGDVLSNDLILDAVVILLAGRRSCEICSACSVTESLECFSMEGNVLSRILSLSNGGIASVEISGGLSALPMEMTVLEFLTYSRASLLVSVD